MHPPLKKMGSSRCPLIVYVEGSAGLKLQSGFQNGVIIKNPVLHIDNVVFFLCIIFERHSGVLLFTDNPNIVEKTTHEEKGVELFVKISEDINNNPVMKKKLNVVFIEDYCVSLAEKLMPASEISEQISLAGKEASGTGNMKFMMNGAITLGTYDGANVEISQLVGMDNCVIFGARDEELVKIQKEGSYKAMDLYRNNPRLNRILNTLIDGTWKEGSYFYNIFNEIMTKNDEFFILYDFESYREAQLKIQELYSDKTKWNTMCLMNVAKSGYFSSDRTIEEYVRDIWNLKKIVTK
mgnify:CR=1 FL=1